MSDHDPFDTTAVEDAREAQERQRDRDRKTADRDLVWLMGNRQGRRIVWRLLEDAGLFTSSFTPNAMQLSFDCGRRHYGGNLLERIHALCPERYPEMVKERADDRARNQAEH